MGITPAQTLPTSRAVACADAIGNTPTMTTIPPPTLYQRWLGWYAPAMRRAVVVAAIGLAVALVLLPFVTWGMAVVAGWDAAALIFLMSIGPIIIRADSPHTERLATREDPAHLYQTAVLLLGASVTSLVGVGFALSLAGERAAHGGRCSSVSPC